MSQPPVLTALLHTDPNKTTVDTASLSDHLHLDVTSDPSAVAERIRGDTDAVIVDTTAIDTADCERAIDRIDARDRPVLLLTAADPRPEVLTLDADAHLAEPIDAETVVRTVERLRERAAEQENGDPDDARDRARDLGGSSVATRPLYRRYPGEFYGLWFLAAITYGFGDIVSTALAVFGGSGIAESNPIVAGVLATFGLPGFLAVKFAILVVLVWISVGGARAGDRLSYYWPPLVATVVGGVLTGWNLWLLYGS